MRSIGAVFLLAALVQAQDSPVFRTSVSQVHVDAQVTHNGRLVPDLKKEDFRVLDEGKPQPIVSFSAVEEPLDLILLFDISGSMQPKIAEVTRAARAGLDELRQGDRVAVAAFNTEVWAMSPFLEDLGAVEGTIHLVLERPFGGGTLILKALDKVLTLFEAEKRTGRRRAVLIVTDNMGARDRREAPIVKRYWEADVLLSGLLVRDLGQRIQTFTPGGLVTRPLRAGINGIVEETGGDLLSADDALDFAEAMRRLRRRYTFYYAMPEAKPREERKVSVQLSAEMAQQFPKARVRARKGYVVPAASP
jgi:Ca-activated chloride channel family protein